jgi:hypothetical protein
LSTNTGRDSIKFAWPLLKDMLGHCQCIVSGAAVEIEPYVAPLSAFGSYWKAKHRVFMSATVTDDAFLVKGLQLAPETITKPLKREAEAFEEMKVDLAQIAIATGAVHLDEEDGETLLTQCNANAERHAYARLPL